MRDLGEDPELDPTAAQPAERRGLLASAGRILLLVAVPLCLAWLPLGTIPGAGTVTASDAVLGCLWLLCALQIASGDTAGVGRRPLAMLSLALAMGVLAALGSELNSWEGHGVFEFFLLLKRFGLAAVLPLSAVLFGSAKTGSRMRWASLLALAALAVFALVPGLQDSLPRPPDYLAEDAGGRATGLVTNPNDLAYTAVALAVLNGAFLPRRPRLRDWLLLAAALAGAGVCLVLAASRSGLLGAAAALSVLAVSRQISGRAKASLVVCAAILVGAGLSTQEFEKRVSRAYREGSREENVSSRLDAQWYTLRASARYPMGVGYTGYTEATAGLTGSFRPLGADNAYLETLLGGGVLGLLALVLLLAVAWRHLAAASPPGWRAPVLQAGFVAFLAFGTASVIPIAVALSPLFFSVIAAASYPDDLG